MRTKILLVEQNNRSFDALYHAFLEKGYEVVSLSHPRHALEAVTIHDFDVAVIGTRLPELDGVELMNRLQRMTGNLRVVLLCGDARGPTQSEALECGAFALVHLPCPISAIEAVVDFAIADRRQSFLTQQFEPQVSTPERLLGER